MKELATYGDIGFFGSNGQSLRENESCNPQKPKQLIEFRVASCKTLLGSRPLIFACEEESVAQARAGEHWRKKRPASGRLRDLSGSKARKVVMLRMR